MYGEIIPIDELINECEKAYCEKNYSKVRWACDRILEQDKTNETALTYDAYCNWHIYHVIFKITDKIHRLYPDNYHAYNVEALAHMYKNKFEEALECSEMGLKIKDYWWLRKNKIEALIGLNRIDEALKFYNTSEIPDYNFTKALIHCGKYSEISEYGDVLSKEDLVDYFLKRCRYLDRKGWSGDEILKVCDEIFKIDKDNEIAFEYMIPELERQDKNDEALEWLNYAIELYPDNNLFYFYKGEILLWAFEDIDGAIESLEKCLSMFEDFEDQWPAVDEIIDALNKKADGFIESGNYKEAVNMYDKILFYRPYEFKALNAIESIIEEHNVNYCNDGQHFKESLKLREESRQRVKKIDDCLKSIEIGEYDDDYIKGCSEFKDYNSFEEYVRDMIIYLMESYPGRSEEHARFLVKCNMSYIKSSYEYKEPVAYSSIEVGYCCG